LHDFAMCAQPTASPTPTPQPTDTPTPTPTPTPQPTDTPTPTPTPPPTPPPPDTPTPPPAPTPPPTPAPPPTPPPPPHPPPTRAHSAALGDVWHHGGARPRRQYVYLHHHRVGLVHRAGWGELGEPGCGRRFGRALLHCR